MKDKLGTVHLSKMDTHIRWDASDSTEGFGWSHYKVSLDHLWKAIGTKGGPWLPRQKKNKEEDPGNYRLVSLTPNLGGKMEQILLQSISRNMKDRTTFVNSEHSFPRGKKKCAQLTQLLIMMKPLHLWRRTEQQTSFTLTSACFWTLCPLALQQPERHGLDVC